MRLKQRVGDFRVRELLGDDYLTPRGDYTVYRVTKRKMTTAEAVAVLSDETGKDAGEIGVAGWKDRQAITIQYMSVPRGKQVRVQSPELRIDMAGFAPEPYSSEFSRGNAFELTVRALRGDDLRLLRTNLPTVREHGVIDYFDDQRFGNLRFGQGWIAKELMLGRHEAALKSLLTAQSEKDNEHNRRFKSALSRTWSDWRACRDVAGKFGAHHSIFEHLAKNPEDFAGAFTYVATRVRLIHLYAWQSHLWNRAVANFARANTELAERALIDCEEGTLVTHLGAPPPAILAKATFRLPGEELADVTDPIERQAFEAVLSDEGMRANELRIEGVSGFHMKGEPRSLLVRPQHLRVRPAEEDALNRGTRMVRVRFELPRGSYASLVVKRLFASSEADVERRRSRRDKSAGGRASSGRSDRPLRERSGHGRSDGRGKRGGSDHDGRRPKRAGQDGGSGERPDRGRESRGSDERRRGAGGRSERGGGQQGRADRSGSSRERSERGGGKSGRSAGRPARSNASRYKGTKPKNP